MFDQIFPNECQKANLVCRGSEQSPSTRLSKNKPNTTVLSGVETKEFHPTTHLFQSCQPLPWISTSLCSQPAHSCPYPCALPSVLHPVFRLTQLQVFSPCCGACNCFWLALAISKTEIHSHPKIFADVSIGRMTMTTLKQSEMRCTIQLFVFIVSQAWGYSCKDLSPQDQCYCPTPMYYFILAQFLF